MSQTDTDIDKQFARAARLYEDEDYSSALREYKLLADSGHSNCHTMVGWMYWKGNGVDKNVELAEKYFLKAAEDNDSEAISYLETLKVNKQFSRAERFYEDEDFPSAFREYKSLADSGHSSCHTMVGWMYRSGTGTDKDLDLAKEYFLKAVEGNDAEAMHYLANLAIVNQDYNEALNWFIKSAAYGYSPALFGLGHMHRRKKYGMRDNMQAYHFYKMSSSLGYVIGRREVASMYIAGYHGFSGRIKGILLYINFMIYTIKLVWSDENSQKLQT